MGKIIVGHGVASSMLPAIVEGTIVAEHQCLPWSYYAGHILLNARTTSITVIQITILLLRARRRSRHRIRDIAHRAADPELLKCGSPRT
jgi:hypothetical protein